MFGFNRPVPKDPNVVEWCKNQLLKRCSYLIENYDSIMATTVYKDKEFHNNRRRIRCKAFLEAKVLLLLEELLLSDKPLDQTQGYHYFERQKRDGQYLQESRVSSELRNKHNVEKPYDRFEFSVFDLLKMATSFIAAQQGDIVNRDRKLEVIHEYSDLARDYYGGREGNICSIRPRTRYIERALGDTGISENEFIKCFCNTASKGDNAIRLTLLEKQLIRKMVRTDNK